MSDQCNVPITDLIMPSKHKIDFFFAMQNTINMVKQMYRSHKAETKLAISGLFSWSRPLMNWERYFEIMWTREVHCVNWKNSSLDFWFNLCRKSRLALNNCLTHSASSFSLQFETQECTILSCQAKVITNIFSSQFHNDEGSEAIYWKKSRYFSLCNDYVFYICNIELNSRPLSSCFQQPPRGLGDIRGQEEAAEPPSVGAGESETVQDPDTQSQVWRHGLDPGEASWEYVQLSKASKKVTPRVFSHLSPHVAQGESCHYGLTFLFCQFISCLPFQWHVAFKKTYPITELTIPTNLTSLQAFIYFKVLK